MKSALPAQDNTISIQDELVAKMKSYDPKGYTYSTLITKAVKKARRQLIYVGFPHHQIDQAIQDCFDMARLEKSNGGVK